MIMLFAFTIVHGNTGILQKSHVSVSNEDMYVNVMIYGIMVVRYMLLPSVDVQKNIVSYIHEWCVTPDGCIFI